MSLAHEQPAELNTLEPCLSRGDLSDDIVRDGFGVIIRSYGRKSMRQLKTKGHSLLSHSKNTVGQKIQPVFDNGDSRMEEAHNQEILGRRHQGTLALLDRGVYLFPSQSAMTRV